MIDFVFKGENVTDDHQTMELVKAGLDPYTSDHYWARTEDDDWEIEYGSYGRVEFVLQAMGEKPEKNILPAWSLLALMSVIPDEKKGCKWTLDSESTLTFEGPGDYKVVVNGIDCDGHPRLIDAFVSLTLKLLGDGKIEKYEKKKQRRSRRSNR